eukprot:gene15690-6982_t
MVKQQLIDEEPQSDGENEKRIKEVETEEEMIEEAKAEEEKKEGENKTTQRQHNKDDCDELMETESERTETLSCPSQQLLLSSQETEENENYTKMYYEEVGELLLITMTM